jgi:hypothetical protein
MTNLFATNKTFTIAGTTFDTAEPYTSVMGFQLVRRNNAIGGGSHFSVSMVTISTSYDDAIIDRDEQRAAKADAKAEATARAVKINNHFNNMMAAA